jgi:pimeloyl-ACP methyl ester carboxylesterase
MSAVVIDGGLIHYEAFGRGEPVIFIHGWLGSWRYWMGTMEVLAPDYRTYAPDLWGFGDSDKSKERYTVADYADLVHDFMDELGVTRASLVGHALGATIALYFATKYPELVSRLAMISLPVTSDAISGRLLDFANNSLLSKMFWWRRIAHSEIQQEAEKTAKGVILLSINSVLGVDAPDLIERISHPTLIVYGERDNVVDPTPSKSLNGQRPNLRPIGLAESRHFPMLEQANKFNRLLKDFLQVGDDLSALELKEEWKRRTR